MYKHSYLPCLPGLQLWLPNPPEILPSSSSPTPPSHSFQKLVICPTHKPNLPMLQKFFLPHYGDMGIPKGYGGEASRKKLDLNKGLTFPTKDPLLHSQQVFFMPPEYFPRKRALALEIFSSSFNYFKHFLKPTCEEKLLVN